ncbi:uncharacterized protein DS421_7g206750 [Arachis hypogaea]|nr:uncharacterized protein DS421_7g206750 [Arachis hypogaea]
MNTNIKILPIFRILISASNLPNFQAIFIFHSSLSTECLVLSSHAMTSSSKTLSTHKKIPHHFLPTVCTAKKIQSANFISMNITINNNNTYIVVWATQERSPELESIPDHRSTDLDPQPHYFGKHDSLFLFILLVMLPNDRGLFELPAALLALAITVGLQR